MPTWFQCKIVYLKEDDKGTLKTVNEHYLLDAVSFIDAETRLRKQLEQSHRDYSLEAIAKKKIADVFPYEEDEIWFKTKVVYTTVDNRSGKEKEVKNTMIVNAMDAHQAYERIQESLKTMLVPFTFPEVIATGILEVYPYTDSKQLGLDFGASTKHIPKEEFKEGDSVLFLEGPHYGIRGTFIKYLSDKKSKLKLFIDDMPEADVWTSDMKLVDPEGFIRSNLLSSDKTEVRVKVSGPTNSKTPTNVV